LDKLAAATGVRKDSAFDALVVEVGEKCQLYSRDTDEWVSGKVVAVNASGGVCVQWEETAAPASPRSGGGSPRASPRRGSDGRAASDTITREQWVSQTSSEFRRAGSSNSNEPKDDNDDDADPEASSQPKSNGAAATPAAATSKKSGLQREQEAKQRRLAPPEKKLARQALLRGPNKRSSAQIKAMVAWTYTADLFYGLTEKERKVLCKVRKTHFFCDAILW